MGVDDKSCSPALYATTGWSGEPNNAIGWSSVCVIFQLSVSAKRYASGGALQIVPGLDREIPSRGLSIYRVRAKMEENPSEYVWSSYQVNALGKESDLCTPILNI